LFAEVEQLEKLTKKRISLKEDFVTSVLRRLTETENTTQEWNYLEQHFPSFFTEKANIKKLRETILQLAVQGKLTAKWRSANPSVENASELLKRIEAEKQQLIAEKKIKKEKPLPPIEDETPYELPESWVWCRLGSITTIKGGKRLPKGEKLTREDTGRVYIRVTDMKNGTIDESDRHYVTEDVFKIISKYIIEKEDLYLTIVGATIGKLGLVPSKFHGMSLTENAARIIKYKVSKDFMYLTMISELIQGQFFDKTNQVGVPKLALHRVAKTLFPLPPLEEQQVIVEKVNSLMALCDELEQQIDNSQTQIEQLMQSCLKEVIETDKEIV
jgi:type I restriction enzyme S subunit